MKPFIRLCAVAAPLVRDNIDTDAIIPSREMRSVSKQGLGEGLFAGWRYRNAAAREENADFILNQPRYRGAEILVSGANFGCGSSREHAVWALAEFGIRAIIAPSFNSIFLANCVANGVLPACVLPTQVEEIGDVISRAESCSLTIDLEAQRIASAQGRSWTFEIDPEAKNVLRAGLDIVGLTLQSLEVIQTFRARDVVSRPWIYWE